MTNSVIPRTTVQLKPSYNIPITLVFIAVPILFIQPWFGGVIALLGLFLMLQAVSLKFIFCLLYTSPSPRDLSTSRMPSSA